MRQPEPSIGIKHETRESTLLGDVFIFLVIGCHPFGCMVEVHRQLLVVLQATLVFQKPCAALDSVTAQNFALCKHAYITARRSASSEQLMQQRAFVASIAGSSQLVTESTLAMAAASYRLHLPVNRPPAATCIAENMVTFQHDRRPGT